jgi:endonuclease/exonuclease/phosphatase (EEP) superfamily protein YafD
MQIEKICKELSNHNGPGILSGDFNTWRKKRKKILDKLAFRHGLTALSFQEDHRKVIFGQVLDHIYVRALVPESTDTYNVQSSDHNPIAAELRFGWSLA